MNILDFGVTLAVHCWFPKHMFWYYNKHKQQESSKLIINENFCDNNSVSLVELLTNFNFYDFYQNFFDKIQIHVDLFSIQEMFIQNIYLLSHCVGALAILAFCDNLFIDNQKYMFSEYNQYQKNPVFNNTENPIKNNVFLSIYKKYILDPFIVCKNFLWKHKIAILLMACIGLMGYLFIPQIWNIFSEYVPNIKDTNDHLSQEYRIGLLQDSLNTYIQENYQIGLGYQHVKYKYEYAKHLYLLNQEHNKQFAEIILRLCQYLSRTGNFRNNPDRIFQYFNISPETYRAILEAAHS